MCPVLLLLLVPFRARPPLGRGCSGAGRSKSSPGAGRGRGSSGGGRGGSTTPAGSTGRTGTKGVAGFSELVESDMADLRNLPQNIGLNNRQYE